MKTPELDRMLAVKDQSQAIGEFIEWLGTQGMWIGGYVDLGHSQVHGAPVPKSIEQLLADFFRIDLVKAEEEKRAILAELGRST